MLDRSALLLAALAAAVLPACGAGESAVEDVPTDVAAEDAAGDAEAGPDADADGAADADADAAPDVPSPDAADVPTDFATDPGDAGPVCGPFPGGECGATEVCDVRSCGIGATGACVERPAACPRVWDPVCGCDGATYSNDCERLVAGAALDHPGECGSGTLCGGLAGFRCPDGETCDVRGCWPDATGTCVPVSDTCDTLYAPVCGCDEVTYPNDCSRLLAGAALDHDGACDVEPACVPECRAVGTAGSAWVDPCTGRAVCTARCDGCTAECQAVDTRSEGWYAVCAVGTAGGCGMAGLAGLIEWTDCGP
jgi:hypothetical protein